MPNKKLNDFWNNVVFGLCVALVLGLLAFCMTATLYIIYTIVRFNLFVGFGVLIFLVMGVIIVLLTTAECNGGGKNVR